MATETNPAARSIVDNSISHYAERSEATVEIVADDTGESAEFVAQRFAQWESEGLLEDGGHGCRRLRSVWKGW